MLRYRVLLISLCMISLGGVVFAQQTGALSGPPSAPPPATQIAATVNGQPITELAVYRGLLGADASKRDAVRNEVLNFLIDNALVDQYLDGQKATVAASEVEAQLTKLKEEIKSTGRTVEDFCKSLVLTEADLRAQITASTRWDKFLQPYCTEKNLRDFFESNKSYFDNSQVHARHILIYSQQGNAVKLEEAKSKIVACRQQIVGEATKKLQAAGQTPDKATQQKRLECIEAAFSEVATAKSECDTKVNGGDLGWFPRAGGKVVEPFARAAFALKPGDLSDVVVTDFGCHLILCVDTKAGQALKFEEIRDAVRDVYSDRMRESVIERMRPTAKIVMGSPR